MLLWGGKWCDQFLSDISIGEDTTANNYNDKQTVLPIISLNYNDDATSNNKMENNNNNDTCSNSNPSDSYCVYKDSYNAVNQHTTMIDWNDINNITQL